MGADGGVCWMKVKDPSKYARVQELLRPFYWLTYVDDYRWSNVEYIRKSPISEPTYLVGTYGSFQDFSICGTLRDILERSEDENVCSDPSLTFLELVEDLATRPMACNNVVNEWVYLTDRRMGVIRPHRDYYSASGERLTILEIMLWDRVHYWLEKLEEELEPIAHMTVESWLTELRGLLEYSNVGSEETWT